MPVKGNRRLAKPRDVWDAYHDKPLNLKPRPFETFEQYLERLVGHDDPLLRLLIAEGYGKPTRYEYLNRLTLLRQVLGETHNALYELWPAD